VVVGLIRASGGDSGVVEELLTWGACTGIDNSCGVLSLRVHEHGLQKYCDRTVTFRIS